MRFLSLILLLSLPCTVSIKAMESDIDIAQGQNGIVFYNDQDYNKKLSIIEAAIHNKFYVSDIRSNKITFPDFTNPNINHELPLPEIKQEMQELTQLCSVPLLYLEHITKITNIAFNVHSKPATLEEKKAFVTHYFSNNLTLKIKYEIMLDRYKLWANNKDITTLKKVPAGTTTVTQDDEYLYKTNRLLLKKAIQDENIVELFKLEKTQINPAGHPLPFDQLIKVGLIPQIHNHIEEFISKLKPISKIQITEGIDDCTIS